MLKGFHTGSQALFCSLEEASRFPGFFFFGHPVSAKQLWSSSLVPAEGLSHRPIDFLGQVVFTLERKSVVLIGRGSPIPRLFFGHPVSGKQLWYSSWMPVEGLSFPTRRLSRICCASTGTGRVWYSFGEAYTDC